MAKAKHYVYRNLGTSCQIDAHCELHEGLDKITEKCWSVRYRGKVLPHQDDLVFTGVEFRVSDKGRQKVLKDQCKNVHAFVVGTPGTKFDITCAYDATGSPAVEIGYNPYKGGTFYRKDTEEPVTHARCVRLAPSGSVYAIDVH